MKFLPENVAEITERTTKEGFVPSTVDRWVIARGSAMQFLGTCGTLTGGTVVLDYYFGRPVENLSDKEFVEANIDRLFAAYEVAMLLVNKFVDEYGSFICAQMHRQFFRRIYCGADPEEMKKFEEAGNVKKLMKLSVRQHAG
ncbi:hypothetical protein ES703_64094 [subsurface metagenome]